MKITQSLSVSKSLPIVWALFQDVPEVATCMPGAKLTEDKGDGVYAGQVSIKLGPFSAAFEGEATITPDPASHSGRVEGKGVDKRGGSRSKMLLDYKLEESNGMTTVTIDADIQLSGPIAQFGRTGIINETAGILIGSFVENVEARLAAAENTAGHEGEAEAQPLPAQDIDAGRMLWLLVKSFFRKLLGRAAV